MSNPFTPQVTRTPGVGQEIQQAMAPLMQALMFQQRQTQQKEWQERQQAMQVLAQGIKEPGFETTEIATQVEERLGLVGFSKEMARLRNARVREATKAQEEFLVNLDVDDKTKEALRAVFVVEQLHPDTPAAVKTNLYQQLAPDAPLGPLDQARLLEIRARTREIDRRLKAFDLENPTLEDQRAVANTLGIEFFPGVDYIDIYETIKSRKEDTPHEIAITAAMQFARTVDFMSRPIFTVEQSIKMGADVVSSLVPGVAIEPAFTPQQEARVRGLQESTAGWIGLRGEGLKDDKIKRQLAAELTIKYGTLLTREEINEILRRAERALPER